MTYIVWQLALALVLLLFILIVGVPGKPTYFGAVLLGIVVQLTRSWADRWPEPGPREATIWIVLAGVIAVIGMLWTVSPPPGGGPNKVLLMSGGALGLGVAVAAVRFVQTNKKPVRRRPRAGK